MREITCPICGSGNKTLVYRARLPRDFDERNPPSPYSGHYQINSCDGCGLVFSSPVMDAAGVAALYEQGTETNVQPGEENNVRHTMWLYYNLAKPYLPDRNRMLDVGCDMGFMLEAAKSDGFRHAVGLEPVPEARRVAQQIPGAEISDKFFEDTDFPQGHFDLVVMIHVLDHLFDPREVLQRAYENLRPGGVVVAVVHNVRSLLFFLLRERFPIFNMYHHYFFSRTTLARLFASQRYEVLKVVGTYNCYSLGFFAKRLPGVPDVVRRALVRVLGIVRLADIPVTIPVGNIGIVARRPTNS